MGGRRSGRVHRAPYSEGQGETIMKFICIAQCQYMSSCTRTCGLWLTFQCGDSTL